MDDAEQNKKMLEQLIENLSEKSVKELIEKKEKRDIQKEVEISNKRRKNWMIALGDGKLSPDDYAMMIDEEDQRMSDIYAKIREDDAIYEPEISTEDLRQMIIHLNENWDYLDADTQKQAIQSMFRKVVIHKEKNSWQLLDLQTV